MTFGLYLLFTCFLLVGFGLWVRGLVVRRLRPERILADLNQEVQSLMAGINQAGDTNISLLEDRISRLSELVQLADRQIDEARVVVDRLNEARLIAVQAIPQVSDRSVTGQSVAIDRNGNASSPPAETSPEGGDEAAIIHGKPADDQDTPERTDEEGLQSNVQDDRERVLSLYRQGLSEDLIASRTGVAVGEVNLIIALQGKRPWQ